MGITCPESLTPSPEFCNEYWYWNDEDKSPDVYICDNKKIACFYIDPVYESTGTAAVRGTKAFTHGQHYFEVKLTSVFGTSVMIGVATKQAPLQTSNYEFVDLIGCDDQSWGLSYKGRIWHGGKYRNYCEAFYDSTVIGVLVDMDSGTLSYFKNGEPLGEAFTNLPHGTCTSELYPIISSTATLSEMELCQTSCRYYSLQDQCCVAIARHVEKENIDCLPLPKGMCELLKNI